MSHRNTQKPEAVKKCREETIGSSEEIVKQMCTPGGMKEIHEKNREKQVKLRECIMKADPAFAEKIKAAKAARAAAVKESGGEATAAGEDAAQKRRKIITARITKMIQCQEKVLN